MDHHVQEFYQEFSDSSLRGNFHKVIPLHENPEIDWNAISKMVPDLCKGWYELAHVSPKDRIEFTRDYWLGKLPYHPKLDDFLARFFFSLDDIGIFVTQQKFDDPFEAHLIYSVKEDSGFFRGASPASEQDVTNLQRLFPDYILPNDYLAFLKIHNGFCKTTDCTGITRSHQMFQTYQTFQTMLADQDPIIAGKEELVNPKSLIPFYESFGMPFYQCFWGGWYPEQEMGNVYSGLTKTVTVGETCDLSPENMAFPTFTDWLMFYLERID